MLLSSNYERAASRQAYGVAADGSYGFRPEIQGQDIGWGCGDDMRGFNFVRPAWKWTLR